MKEVLHQMFVQGYITSDQRAEAVARAQEPDFLQHGTINNRLAPHFANYVQTELMERLHVKREDLSRAGLVVQTTLDLPLQDKTLEIAQRQINQMRAEHNMQNASVVVIDPNTGEILTLLGNANPDDPDAGDFDVASQGYRQPGSTFKPYTYITAIENGISPGKTVLDEPITFQMCCGLPPYTPTNYSGKFGGWMSYRTALQLSLNIPSLKLINEVGVDKTLAMIENLGITDYQGSPNMTMALGSLSMHLLDHTAAFSAFANDGILMEKHAVVSVKDIYGNVIYDFNNPGKRVLSPQATFILSNVLSDNEARTPEFGKCSPLLLYSTSEQECYAGNPGQIRPVAAKTGTTNDWKDSLTMGYTPDYTVGVWVGNNDGTAMREVTGLMGAAPIWHEVMIALHEGKPIKNFEQPEGVEKRTQAYPGLTTTDWYITKKTN
jgi:penicillin-binding protein 1A